MAKKKRKSRRRIKHYNYVVNCGEAAEILGVTRAMVCNYVAAGRIEGRKMGVDSRCHWVFDEDDVWKLARERKSRR